MLKENQFDIPPEWDLVPKNAISPRSPESNLAEVSDAEIGTSQEQLMGNLERLKDKKLPNHFFGVFPRVSRISALE